MNTDATARSASLYGARGWTDTTGAAALLAALECGPRLSKDFTRFAGLRAPEARALAQILPDDFLETRQAADLVHTLRYLRHDVGPRLGCGVFEILQPRLSDNAFVGNGGDAPCVLIYIVGTGEDACRVEPDVRRKRAR